MCDLARKRVYWQPSRANLSNFHKLDRNVEIARALAKIDFGWITKMLTIALAMMLHRLQTCETKSHSRQFQSRLCIVSLWSWIHSHRRWKFTYWVFTFADFVRQKPLQSYIVNVHGSDDKHQWQNQTPLASLDSKLRYVQLSADKVTNRGCKPDEPRGHVKKSRTSTDSAMLLCIRHCANEFQIFRDIWKEAFSLGLAHSFQEASHDWGIWNGAVFQTFP